MLHVSHQMITAALRDRKGISALEYAILAAAILGAVSVTLQGIGTDMSTIFTNLKTTMDSLIK